MKLSSERVNQALGQFDAQVIPENHPTVPQLTELFGEHTYFLDGTGLAIVEPAEKRTGPAKRGRWCAWQAGATPP